ncbi:glycosyltransferase family 2 protein [Jidongwangia harbinensis]|uniref:glycosyltransferase family 2 protein n=1 Tax=Jidongwangia harbinensis TaxID=2878561 RepID=UPI001CDA3B22|nr:glycosyltransferase family 2 protein [Jidongwangia harbinensis]MCA2214830.1 glycosyltransferase family 2 protein [Jidongwangia harbinensis]
MSVVLAPRNEPHDLPRVLAGLPPVHEVIVVDDGTVSGYGPGVRVLPPARGGPGHALARGFAASTGDVVVTLAADGSADPGELPRFVEALRAGADVVHGSRYRPGGGDLVGGRLDRFLNALLCRLVNLLFGARFTDVGSGYHAYWRAVLPVLDLPAVDLPDRRRGTPAWGDGPEIDPLLAVRAAAQGLRVVEVSSVGYPRRSGPQPARRPALRALRTVLREWRRHRSGPPVPARLGPDRRETTGSRYANPSGAASRFPTNPAPATGGSLYDTLTGIGYDRSAARQETTGGVRYPTSPRRSTRDGTPAGRHAAPGDPAVHRLDPGDSGVHHLHPAASGPHHLYSASSGPHQADPADSGVHRLEPDDSGVHQLEPDDRRRRAGAVYGTGVPEIGGRRRRFEPDDRLLNPAPPREVGGGRRRLEYRERHPGRPELTVIPGDGGEPGTAPDRTTHLRALPGDRHRR